LNQLERATVRERPTRWDECAGPYTDTAFLFVLVGLDLVRDGGRVVLVQPQSLAAARDAAGVRDAVAARGAVARRCIVGDGRFVEAAASDAHPGLQTSFARKYRAAGRPLYAFEFVRRADDDQPGVAASNTRSM
jgi:hypothetical protein